MINDVSRYMIQHEILSFKRFETRIAIKPADLTIKVCKSNYS